MACMNLNPVESGSVCMLRSRCKCLYYFFNACGSQLFQSIRGITLTRGYGFGVQPCQLWISVHAGMGELHDYPAAISVNGFSQRSQHRYCLFAVDPKLPRTRLPALHHIGVPGYDQPGPSLCK